MPQVKIKETDLTTAPLGEYKNFAVVVPGILGKNDAGTDVDGSAFNVDGICELRTQAEFVAKVGIANNPLSITTTTPAVEAVEGVHFTAEEIAAASEGDPAYGKTTDDWKVAPVEGKAATTETRVVQIGNQIAYELLGLGYPVIYKKIEAAADLDNDTFWEPLKDKATYDFRFIISGLLSDNGQSVGKKIIKVVNYDEDNATEVNGKGRGDAVALLDIDESVYNTTTNRASRNALLSAITANANLIGKSKYAAVFAPTVCLLGTDSAYDNHKFPASFYYLACFKYMLDHGFAEWYAAAGYTRGVCKYNVESADVNFGEYLINALEPRSLGSETGALAIAVNVVAKIRGNYYLWGNRTAEGLKNELVASHFLNIRQLCSTLKKQIYIACRRFTFDPNSDVLWINFCNALKPTLEGMKADQGIKDYKIVKLYTAKKAELKARVRIIPIEAVEDFDIEITLEDNFGETSATAVER